MVLRLFKKKNQKPAYLDGSLEEQIAASNFYSSNIEDKIDIFNHIVNNPSLPESVVGDFADGIYLKNVLDGENNPKSDFECELEDNSGDLTHIIAMLQDIYVQVIPVKGIENAKSYFEQAKNHFKYVSEKTESGNALATGIACLGIGVNYLKEAQFELTKEQYRQIGDAFFSSGVQLHQLNKTEARSAIGYALRYYEKGEISIPEKMKENWNSYRWGETTDLQMDWNASDFNSFDKLLNLNI